MKINPLIYNKMSKEVRAVFDNLPSVNSWDFENGSFDVMRENYKKLGETLGGEAIEVSRIDDFIATGPLGDIPLRRYTPEDINSKAAVIYIHGGGWCTGDLDTHDKVCRRLADVSGLTIFAINYRLAPENPAPAGVVDVLAAIRWIHSHAEELNIDASRLGIAGDSAGGSLTAVATQQLRHEIKFLAQVLYYPCTDLSKDSDKFPSRIRNKNSPPLTFEEMRLFTNTFISNFDANDVRLSPLLQEDFSNLPPALIFTCECDVLLDDGFFYKEKLEKFGVPVNYIEEPGMVHGFIEMAGALTSSRKAFDISGEFLKSKLL